MATTVRVEVKGLRELGQALSELSADVQKKVANSAVQAGAAVIRDAAKRKAPVSSPADTPEVPPGYLRDNIIARRNRKKGNYTAQYAVTVRHNGKKADLREDETNPYQIGIFNEFGTVKMGAQPFMRPAFDETKQQAVGAIQKRLKQRIDRANRKAR